MLLRYYAYHGSGNELDVMIDDNVDLDSEFDCVCNDTGEKLTLKGWLFSFNVVEGED